MYTSNITINRINKRHVFSNGGFITYWKIYWSLLREVPMWFRMVNATHTSKMKCFLINAYWLLGFVAKTPWWLCIKPLGQVYSTKIIYQGEYVIRDGVVSMHEFKVNKTVMPRLFTVPFVAFPWHINDTDMERILK